MDGLRAVGRLLKRWGPTLRNPGPMQWIFLKSYISCRVLWRRRPLYQRILAVG